MRTPRICPQCGNTVSGPTCPDDGSATMTLEHVESLTLEPGRRILERFVVGVRIESDHNRAIHEGYDEAQRRQVRIGVLRVAATREDSPDTSLLEALERLEHPGIARVVATGRTEGGELVIVEDTVGGQSLEDALRLGPLDLKRTVDLGIALLAALDAAHRIGITYRELSPARVRMLPDGRTTLTGIGLGHFARALGPDATNERGSAFVRQADIFAVGALLFEARTGQPYRHAPGGTETSAMTGIDAPLRAFLARCLDQKPWNRFQYAAMARAALELVRIERVAATAPKRFAPLVLDMPVPRAEVASRASIRPLARATSGLLTSGAKGASKLNQAPVAVAAAMPPAADVATPVARVARPLVRRVGARRPWGWLVAAAALIVAGAFALTRPKGVDQDAGGQLELEVVTAPRGEPAAPPAVHVVAGAEGPAVEETPTAGEEEVRRAAVGVATAAAEAAAQARGEAEAAAQARGEAEAAAFDEAEAVARAETRALAEAAAEARAEAEAAARAEAEAAAAAEARKRAEARARAEARRKAAVADRPEPREAPPKARPEARDPLAAGVGLRRAMIVTEPSGASVHVDGALIGKSPMTLSWPAQSTSRVSVTLAGHQPATFTLTDGQHAKMLQLELQPLE